MRVETLPDDIWMTVCTGLDLCDHLQLAQTCPALWRWYRTCWTRLYRLHRQYASWRQMLPLQRRQNNEHHDFVMYALSVYENEYRHPVYGEGVRRFERSQRWNRIVQPFGDKSGDTATLARRRRAPPQCAAAVRGRRCRRPPAPGRRLCVAHAQRPLPLVWPPIFVYRCGGDCSSFRTI